MNLDFKCQRSIIRVHHVFELPYLIFTLETGKLNTEECGERQGSNAQVHFGVDESQLDCSKKLEGISLVWYERLDSYATITQINENLHGHMPKYLSIFVQEQILVESCGNYLQDPSLFCVVIDEAMVVLSL